jgi:hypothetical protein
MNDNSLISTAKLLQKDKMRKKMRHKGIKIMNLKDF